eukprot:1651594-Rhodomonas_salina.2
MSSQTPISLTPVFQTRDCLAHHQGNAGQSDSCGPRETRPSDTSSSQHNTTLSDITLDAQQPGSCAPNTKPTTGFAPRRFPTSRKCWLGIEQPWGRPDRNCWPDTAHSRDPRSAEQRHVDQQSVPKHVEKDSSV